MPIRPIKHFVWQVLREAKRSKKPLSGRQLRVMPTRQSRDGTFFAGLVEGGFLTFVTGDASKPFEATYALTERGLHAAEFGEYEYEFKRQPEPEPAPSSAPPVPARRRGPKG